MRLTLLFHMLSAVGRLDRFRNILAVCLESWYEVHGLSGLLCVYVNFDGSCDG